ncbi:MAG TPA: S8 family serine peptidase [Candidatus Lokiarchaeia archaeon]|nr:S8 family serine peptidase [Candidatus Lokiarchaeia archaeon]
MMNPSKGTSSMVACILLVLVTGMTAIPRESGQACVESAIIPSSLWNGTPTDTKLLGLQDLFWSYNITGQNSTIAILDTGINAGHEVFGGNLTRHVYWKDVTNESYATPIDIFPGGHGTLCASLAAGNSNITAYKGVAPDANILAVKMFYTYKGEPDADNPQAEAAVNYTLANQNAMHVRVASCSWGDDNQSSNGNDELSQAVEKLVDAGIVTVVAAGNVEGKVVHVAAPGVAPKVITVGALDPGNFRVPSFSLTGPTGDGRIKPDIIAPGVGDNGASGDSNTSYITSQGTSFSTPIVAGIADLLVQKYPWLDPYEIKNLLCLTALECENSGTYPDNSEGWGIVNPAGAIMTMSNYWNSTIPLEILIRMNSPLTRSYFTKVHLDAGVTEEISIDPVASNLSTTNDISNYFQASVFDLTGDLYGVPRMLAIDHGGKLLFAPPSTGDYILAIKPLPAAWMAAGGNLAVQFQVVLAQTMTIQIAWVAGWLFLAGAIALVFAMTILLLKERRRKD